MGSFSTLRICLVAFLASSSSAHFLLNYPTTVGFSDDDETTAPCGGFTVDFSKDNVTDFHVGGDSIAVQSVHPQAVWLFRATLDQTASGNWTSLLPSILQDSLGSFCEKNVVVPSSWAGSKGVISVVQDAPDGLLYQCAAVNFVSGTATTIPSSCTNATGLTATYSADAVLSSLPASATSAAATTTGTGAASTTSASSASTSKSAASALVAYSYDGVGSLVWVGLLGGATFMACLL